LNLREYFNGTLDAHGVFTDRSGRVVKRFTVLMECTWKGDQGVLDESFVYSDGSTEKRIWRLTDLGGGRYSGRADDVSARPKVKPKATPFAGATPWPCPWTAACGTWTLTIGCT
jgi:hypothetical protein